MENKTSKDHSSTPVLVSSTPELEQSQPSSSVVSMKTDSGRFAKMFSQRSAATLFVALFAVIGVTFIYNSFAASTALTKTWQSTADWSAASSLNNVVTANNQVALAMVKSVTPAITTAPAPTTNLAAGAPVTASSSLSTAGNAVDGNLSSSWTSQGTGTQWLVVDLRAAYTLSQVKLDWGQLYAKSYQIQTSIDGQAWVTAISETAGTGGSQTLNISGSARYVRIYITQPGSKNSWWRFRHVIGYALKSIAVYGSSGQLVAGSNNTAPTTKIKYAKTGNIVLSFDAGASSTWDSAKATATLPAATSISYQYATSTDNRTFSAWNSSIGSLSPGRYLKLKASLSTSNTSVTPVLSSLSLTYTVGNSRN